MLWNCRFSVEIWKETENHLNERFKTNIEIKYHTIIMRFNPTNYKIMKQLTQSSWQLRKEYAIKISLKHIIAATIRIWNNSHQCSTVLLFVITRHRLTRERIENSLYIL